MSTKFIALSVAGLAVTTILSGLGTPTSADAAARKRCQAGTYYNRAKRACLPAGAQLKPVRTCMAFTVDGGITNQPCALGQ